MTATVHDGIPHSRPYFGREEVDAVGRVIESGHIAQGREVESLEREWAAASGTLGSVCVGSGLAALRLALHAVGVGAGSEVIVPAYSCIAVLNAVLALGASPVLADVTVDDWTLDPASVARLRTSKTAAIVAVHLFGMPAAMRALHDFGLPVIEDCAHGIGGRVHGKPFGGYSTASIASFYATKMIAAGEGGVVASDRRDVLDVVRGARNPSDQRPSGTYLNDKLTDMEAAVARVQLSRLSWTLAERAVRARRYSEMLQGLGGLCVQPHDIDGRIWYRYAIRLTSLTAAEAGRRLHESGIDADQPVWDLRGVVSFPQELRGASLAFDRVLSLPLYPDLTAAEQQRVCDALRGALSH